MSSDRSIPLPATESWNIMEVDSGSKVIEESAEVVTHIVDSNPGSPQKSPKDRIVDILDQVELHVERLRREALKLEEERDTLLTTLDTLKNSEMMIELSESDREHVLHYADHIANHCLTVEVLVKTTRDGTQEEALHQVNGFIDSLVIGLREDPFGTKSKCIAFMNSCSSHTSIGNIDKNFESAILGCTLDDQKRIKKRLQGLLDYIDTLSG
ncbi:BAG family molecular chaperone regulator 2 [Schistocerca americana]|uniref:BAG family molecular chaperone regulator 2 n=1 Tax=Schistocerca americana TaxID=7009 RepID=UPI001F5021C8|nr:BAG family molecular chaperone regulator 2 [Schistocerca americana]XP_047117189.1 BAG family molecular chaperone regulator 2 [Schistocerca piceifrons]XP_049815531.1 BAG family molecular chaperone regulator 2-like [Schistocerca nitens]XP_049830986.1 BAG family molecular chaperone regulator 2 [Schistocerca gregaria]XP_049963743.1 BAG family molecular chaperone regulator 2 [Schistocerca serialis cubense]